MVSKLWVTRVSRYVISTQYHRCMWSGKTAGPIAPHAGVMLRDDILMVMKLSLKFTRLEGPTISAYGQAWVSTSSQSAHTPSKMRASIRGGTAPHLKHSVHRCTACGLCSGPQQHTQIMMHRAYAPTMANHGTRMYVVATVECDARCAATLCAAITHGSTAVNDISV
jgi:hypothetical protein